MQSTQSGGGGLSVVRPYAKLTFLKFKIIISSYLNSAKVKRVPNVKIDAEIVLDWLLDHSSKVNRNAYIQTYSNIHMYTYSVWKNNNSTCMIIRSPNTKFLLQISPLQLKSSIQNEGSLTIKKKKEKITYRKRLITWVHLSKTSVNVNRYNPEV